MALCLAASLMVATAAGWSQTRTGPISGPQQDSSQAADSSAAKSPKLPRGKKLMLTDGTFQLVRDYKVEGDRVRYYSLDSHQWEEMPAALVDWAATKKVAAEEAKRDTAEVAKIHAREEASKLPVLDIDASLEAAPGVFLPPDPGVYIYDAKSVVQLTQANTDVKTDKGQTVKQIFTPIPIVASRRTISIPGTRAKLRVTTGQPEIYIRTWDAHEPEIQLIPTKVKGYSRVLEHIDTRFKEETLKADTVPMQRWVIARGVFRFTLGESLPPGEYALAEVMREETISIYVWDFGVDAGAPAPAAKSK